MNAMLYQITSGLAQCRERAKVVGISNPESAGSSSATAGVDPAVLAAFAAVLAVIAIVAIVVAKRNTKR